MGQQHKKATMVFTQLNATGSYTHPADSHMSFSRVYNVSNALHLGDGPICVETTPQHGSMLSANLSQYKYGSWLNEPMWVATDATATISKCKCNCNVNSAPPIIDEPTCAECSQP